MKTGVGIKICGLTSAEDAALAVRAGADAIGLVFAESGRRVGIELGRVVADAAKSTAAGLGRSVDIYGVFVNEEPSTVMRVAALAGLDVIQLHGDETPKTAAALDGLRVVKAIPVAGPEDHSRALEYGPAAGFEAVLLDGFSAEARGGTGRTACWEAASAISARMRVILAGGLTPGNVVDAIRMVRPAMIDVSSGVETSPGIKSVDLVERFIEEARSWQD